MRRLVVIEGQAEPEGIACDAEVCLGRAREADLRLFDETVSRRHARLRVDGDRVLLEDLGSANGTLLNGERIDGPRALFDGDVIGVGAVRLRFGSGQADDRPTVGARSEERVEASLDPDAADPAEEAREEASLRRLRLVCQGAQACADAADPAEVPLTLLALVREAFAPDRASVSLLLRGRLETAAAFPEGSGPPASRTLRARALEEGEAVLVRDPAEEGAGASLVRSRYRSVLIAPLKTAEGVLGAVAVEAEAAGRWGPEDLRALAAAARQAALALRNLRTLGLARAAARRPTAGRSGDTPAILGDSPALESVRAQVARAAAADAPVLVTGETGTGKELVARHLHEGGPRRTRPFVALNGAALVEGLLESELFGHEKGAFTGASERREGRIAEAADGTLLLDEVGELSPALQAKLLRVLSEGTFTRVGGREVLRMRCRLVSATNRDVEGMVAEGTFRQDLYYRMAVLRIDVPPLRTRVEDVDVLAEAGLERLAARMGRRVPRLAADAREVLRRYPWPGNVRELLGVLERALVLMEGDTLKAPDLPLEVREGRPRISRPEAEDGPPEVLTMREAERRAVLAALRSTRGRKGRAAEVLGVSWPTLNRKIREYGLEEEARRATEA